MNRVFFTPLDTHFLSKKMWTHQKIQNVPEKTNLRSMLLFPLLGVRPPQPDQSNGVHDCSASRWNLYNRLCPDIIFPVGKVGMKQFCSIYRSDCITAYTRSRTTCFVDNNMTNVGKYSSLDDGVSPTSHNNLAQRRGGWRGRLRGQGAHTTGANKYRLTPARARDIPFAQLFVLLAIITCARTQTMDQVDTATPNGPGAANTVGSWQ